MVDTQDSSCKRGYTFYSGDIMAAPQAFGVMVVVKAIEGLGGTGMEPDRGQAQDIWVEGRRI